MIMLSDMVELKNGVAKRGCISAVVALMRSNKNGLKNNSTDI